MSTNFRSEFVLPPAYGHQNPFKVPGMRLFRRFFGCKHAHVTIPAADSQTCLDCGATRDYIFSESWRTVYTRLLTDYTTGYLDHDAFIAHFKYCRDAHNALFIGEWRKACL